MAIAGEARESWRASERRSKVGAGGRSVVREMSVEVGRVEMRDAAASTISMELRTEGQLPTARHGRFRLTMR